MITEDRWFHALPNSDGDIDVRETSYVEALSVFKTWPDKPMALFHVHPQRDESAARIKVLEQRYMSQAALRMVSDGIRKVLDLPASSPQNLDITLNYED